MCVGREGRVRGGEEGKSKVYLSTKAQNENYLPRVYISKNMATLILQRPLTFTLKALLNPDAKNPPKGAMREAKMERGKEWSWAG